jgi:hypothetical protein
MVEFFTKSNLNEGRRKERDWLIEIIGKDEVMEEESEEIGLLKVCAFLMNKGLDILVKVWCCRNWRGAQK